MKKEELKIGNIIDFGECNLELGGNRYDIITNLEFGSPRLYVSNAKNYRQLEYCNGIKLSKDVLECTNLIQKPRKFSKNNLSYILIDSLILKSVIGASKIDCFFLASESDYYGLIEFSNVQIKYLHELQNPYYSLVGEELIIDIEKLNNLNK